MVLQRVHSLFLLWRAGINRAFVVHILSSVVNEPFPSTLKCSELMSASDSICTSELSSPKFLNFLCNDIARQSFKDGRILYVMIRVANVYTIYL